MASYLDKVEGKIHFDPWEEFESVPGAHEAVQRAQWSLKHLQKTACDISTNRYQEGTIEKLRQRAEVRRKRQHDDIVRTGLFKQRLR